MVKTYSPVANHKRRQGIVYSARRSNTDKPGDHTPQPHSLSYQVQTSQLWTQREPLTVEREKQNLPPFLGRSQQKAPRVMRERATLVPRLTARAAGWSLSPLAVGSKIVDIVYSFCQPVCLLVFTAVSLSVGFCVSCSLLLVCVLSERVSWRYES